jgi:hypothetical protein
MNRRGSGVAFVSAVAAVWFMSNGRTAHAAPGCDRRVSSPSPIVISPR